jgi:amino acid transporter
MFELVIQIIIGLVLIIIGFSNRKGNLKLLHSYHVKNVKKEDELPFGKLIGLGSIIVGITIIVVSIFDFLTRKEFTLVSNILLFSGLIPGISIILYALFKYNKGIF